MNVTLPESTKLDLKSKIIYGAIILFCIVSIFIVIWFQFIDGKTVTTVGNLKGKSEEGYEKLKAEFNDLFTNSLQNYDGKYDKKKVDESKELVYTGYSKQENQASDYNIDVKIPYINIKNSTIDKYNKEIKETFEEKAEEILETTNKNSIYTLQYNAYVQDGILSIIIKANLKEGSNPQRVIVKTYNYNLETNKPIELKELIDIKEVGTDYVQNKINEEIEIEHKKSEDVKSMGYSIFERNVDDEIYKLDNVKEFYFHDGSIYIVFAYGNTKHTSELDVAVI